MDIKFKKDGKTHSGKLVGKRYFREKLILTVSHGGEDIDINGADAIKSCEGCEYFERKSEGDYFGTCEYTHKTTEAVAVCRYHSFAWGENQQE